MRWHIEKSCKRYSCSLINTNYLKAHLIMFKTISLAASALLLVSTAAQAIPVSGQGTWETTLQARDLDGDGVTDAFYDTELNVTWLRAVGGVPRTHAQTLTFASSFVVGIYSGWRVPFVVDTGTPGCNPSSGGGTDCGQNVQTKIGSVVYSEMAHLFYNTLGNKAQCAPVTGICVPAQTGFGLTNTGNFQNLQNLNYWSGTDQAGTASSWFFTMGSGAQGSASSVNQFYTMVVRNGDINAVAAIPEPETYALMLGGLAALAVVQRRRKSGASKR